MIFRVLQVEAAVGQRPLLLPVDLHLTSEVITEGVFDSHHIAVVFLHSNLLRAVYQKQAIFFLLVAKYYSSLDWLDRHSGLIFKQSC
ncbi:hypothetical protein Desgi_2310 [Desulfoscipio gibsoniae DSM 7213]|uniref:Uncharacterized protein n=1 Tax=Desulfoscipio gibsoniae DSM 7213 TaxID=767817 RepID=R4KQ04_9FIRM|nr:hypothetical protein [Desulfoscipio gibsoniae]AGL01731.1 hypothetical protein Desgi_2310 [Desulfoscipio gibsoniae DSM 7213]